MFKHRLRSFFGVTLILALAAFGQVRLAASAPPSLQGDAEITIRLWDSFSDEAESNAIEEFYAAFEAAHPNITIEREVVPYAQAQATANTVMASGTGPDLIYYDTGPASGGALATAGLLLPLDDYAAQYGWNERIFQYARDRATFDGKLYGLAYEIEFIGMYYNQTLLEQEGLQIPDNAEDLPAFCAAAQEKGYIPIAFGNNPGWQSFHQFGMLANNALGIEEMGKMLYGGQAQWTRPELVEAVTLFYVTMRDAGCFIPDTNAITYDDANALFYTGQALAHTTGTWLISDIEANTTDYEIAIRPFPSIGGKTPVLPAGVGSAWFVSAQTEHPDEVAMLLDHLFSDASAKLWVEQARFIPPVALDPTGLNLSPLLGFAVETMQGVTTGQTELGYFIDTAAPEAFNAMMQDGFQAVLAGTKTPEQQLADLQEAWEGGQ